LVLNSSKDAWLPGRKDFTIKAVSACDSMTTIGENRIHPLFVTLCHAARASKLKKGYGIVEMSWAEMRLPIPAGVQSIMVQDLDGGQRIAFTLAL